MGSYAVAVGGDGVVVGPAVGPVVGLEGEGSEKSWPSRQQAMPEG